MINWLHKWGFLAPCPVWRWRLRHPSYFYWRWHHWHYKTFDKWLKG